MQPHPRYQQTGGARRTCRHPSVSPFRRSSRANRNARWPRRHPQLWPRRRRVYLFLGLRSRSSPPRGLTSSRLRQLNCLEGTDDVIRALVLEEAFVKAGAEVPGIAFVIFIAIKTPDTAHDDQATDPVVPEIAQEMEAQIGPGISAFETDVIVNHDLRHWRIVDGVRGADLGGARVVTQRPALTFRVDDTA